MKEASVGFSIGTYDEPQIIENARERVGYDPDDRQKWLEKGLVENARITDRGWRLLDEDIAKLERNSLAYLRKKFKSVRDEGHGSYGDLIGTVWFDPRSTKHAELVNLAYESNERIDMADSSYGDLYRYAWKGVSDFGQSVLGGSIIFFGAEPEVLEEVEDTVEKAYRRRKARKR